MEIIFLAFANSRSEPLETLQYEDEEVYKILSRKVKEDEFHIHRSSFATVKEISEYLLLYQHQISIFLFSGHAGRDALVMEGEEKANAEGIAAQLGKCPNLKLVVLNGCSTQGQVETLLTEGVPTVVATNAPVEDKKASQFSISFFQALCEQQKTIKEAFNDGLAAAQTIGNIEFSHRGAVPRNKNTKPIPTWGVFCAEGNEFHLEWRLQNNLVTINHIEANSLLLDSIWDSIYPNLELEQEKRSWNRNDKLDIIITKLPHLISEFLRKLIALPTPGEIEEEFYHEIGFNRLKFLTYTYITCIELLGITLLAQLWDELSKSKIQDLPENLKKELTQLLTINFTERRTYSFIPLIQAIKIFFETHKIPFFIKEFTQLSEKFKENTEFYKACLYIENNRAIILDENGLAEEKIVSLCMEMEKRLSIVLRELGFLVRYDMASMKHINFIKYKHQQAPSFEHNFVQLNFRPSGMDITAETLDDSMDNGSIVFINKQKDGFTYLNLSPFIIDENSYDAKATLASLCIFQSFEKLANSFTYRFIYKPTANMLVVNGMKDYFPLIRDQMNAFSNLITNKELIKP